MRVSASKVKNNFVLWKRSVLPLCGFRGHSMKILVLKSATCTMLIMSRPFDGTAIFVSRDTGQKSALSRDPGTGRDRINEAFWIHFISTDFIS